MSKTFTVSTAAELQSALASAGGGDTIMLAAGNYGDLTLNAKSGFNFNFPSNVTIASVDPANPAVFTGLDMHNANNLTFQDVTFDYTFAAGDPAFGRPFSVMDSGNIAFKGCIFDGDLAKGVSPAADGYGYGIGLGVRNSNGVTVEGCEFFDFWKGAVFSQSQNLNITGNDIHSMRMDGLNFAEVSGVLIEANTIHDFAGSPNSKDHSDMIQFWTNGTKTPSQNIVIRGNHLDVGDGTATQSIFMRNDMVDRGLAGANMFYQNLLIENNVIVNAHAHGITVGETNGLTIRGNSVLHDDGGKDDGADAQIEIPRINVSGRSVGVTISQNLTADINGWTGQPGWTVGSNLFVQDQDPNAAGYYGNIFAASSLSGGTGLHDFRLLPGGAAATGGIGAYETRTAPASGLDALFHVSAAANGDLFTRVFDASFSTLNGKAIPAGAVYEWTFGDGTKATGVSVSHVFPGGGNFGAVLSIKLPNGQTAQDGAVVGIQGSTLIDLDASGRLIAYDHGTATILNTAKTVVPEGIQLGGTKLVASIAKTHLHDLFAADDFAISMKLDADSAGASGDVFRLHGSMVASVNKKGEFTIQMSSDDGSSHRLTSTGLKVNDLKDHDISIRVNNGAAELWVDGKLADTSAFTGHLKGLGSQGLVFGNPWGKQAFFGDLKDFDITLGSTGNTQTPQAPQTNQTAQPTQTSQLTKAVAEKILVASAETPPHDDDAAASASADAFEFWADAIAPAHSLAVHDLI